MRTAQNRAVRVSEVFVTVDQFLKEIEDFDEFGRPCRELRQPEGCHAPNGRGLKKKEKYL